MTVSEVSPTPATLEYTLHTNILRTLQNSIVTAQNLATLVDVDRNDPLFSKVMFGLLNEGKIAAVNKLNNKPLSPVAFTVAG